MATQGVEAEEEMTDGMTGVGTGKCIRRPARSAEWIAKFLSDRAETSPFIAVIVSKGTASPAETTEGETTGAETTGEGKLCIGQPARSAERAVKFLSDRAETNRFIAAIVLAKEAVLVRANPINPTKSMTK